MIQKLYYHGLCGAKSCCISDVPSQWEGQNFNPHYSNIFQPILMKLKTKKDIWNTTQHAKFSSCGTTGRGLRREDIFCYFLCSILFFVFLLTPTGHNRRPITTICGSKCVFPRKVGRFGISMIKINVWGQNSPITWFLGVWIGILNQIC